MRNAMCWTAAVLVAAGCGEAQFMSVGGPTGQGDGTGGTADERPGGNGEPQGGIDEHTGGDLVCAQCKVTGGGQIVLGDERAQFAVQAFPAEGAGFEGAGVAATGKIRIHPVPSGHGKTAIEGEVDTIVSCGRAGSVLTAKLAGKLACGDRFEVEVTDGGEPADDTISYAGSFGPVAIATGNIQVHQLEGCEPADGGSCSCEDERCLPCGGSGTGGDTGGTPGGDTSGGGGTDGGGGGFIPL